MYQLMNGRRGGRSVIKFQNIRIHKSKRLLFCFCFIQFLKRECNYKFCLKITKTKKNHKKATCLLCERENWRGLWCFSRFNYIKGFYAFSLIFCSLKKNDIEDRYLLCVCVGMCSTLGW